MKKIARMMVMMTAFAWVLQAQTNPVVTLIDSVITKSVVAAYAANDVVNDSLTAVNKLFRFEGVVTTKGYGALLQTAILSVDTPNTVNGSFKLLLFKDTLANQADNAAWVSSGTYNKNYVGSVEFSLATNGSAVAVAEATPGLAVNVANNKVRLYGVLLAKGAYTPKQYMKVIISLSFIR
jgi:hypothetical protein